MTPILDRIRARGGEVIRDRWKIRIRRGRLDADAMGWIKGNREALMREVWPEYEFFEERAAIREYCGEQSRDEAEAGAYDDVMRRVAPC